jgi:hypothetical protein
MKTAIILYIVAYVGFWMWAIHTAEQDPNDAP